MIWCPSQFFPLRNQYHNCTDKNHKNMLSKAKKFGNILIPTSAIIYIWPHVFWHKVMNHISPLYTALSLSSLMWRKTRLVKSAIFLYEITLSAKSRKYKSTQNPREPLIHHLQKKLRSTNVRSALLRSERTSPCSSSLSWSSGPCQGLQSSLTWAGAGWPGLPAFGCNDFWSTSVLLMLLLMEVLSILAPQLDLDSDQHARGDMVVMFTKSLI